MVIDRLQYEEAYRCARAVHNREMRLTDAKNRLKALGINPNSAADFVYIFKHMLAGQIYKRAMSAEATEDFILWIKRDYGQTEFRNALAALKEHIPYKGGAMRPHLAILEKYGASTPDGGSHIPAVRILPMTPGDSHDYTIEEMQENYFLSDLPKLSGRYRFKTGLEAEKGSVVLFQYRASVVATAVYWRTERFEKPDRDGYVGVLCFDPDSIRVFDPIGSEAVHSVWPEFDRFSHVKHDLAPIGYREFRRMQVKVRVPRLGADSGIEDDESNHDPYALDGSDSRERALRQIRLRRGQQKFRNALRKRYGDRCVVTGCEVLALLEAAHISPYRGDNDNHPENGVLLRADIHTLFDLNLLAFHPGELKVVLHPDVIKEYAGISGGPLRCAPKSVPSKAALQLRYEVFLARSQSPA